MSRYIDADKLMRQVENLPQKEGKVLRVSVYNLITFGCTADVVVRCKDCKYVETSTHPITGKEAYFCRYGIKPMVVKDNFYCGHGERKDENGK